MLIVMKQGATKEKIDGRTLISVREHQQPSVHAIQNMLPMKTKSFATKESPANAGMRTILSPFVK